MRGLSDRWRLLSSQAPLATANAGGVRIVSAGRLAFNDDEVSLVGHALPSLSDASLATLLRSNVWPVLR